MAAVVEMGDSSQSRAIFVNEGETRWSNLDNESHLLPNATKENISTTRSVLSIRTSTSIVIDTSGIKSVVVNETNNNFLFLFIFFTKKSDITSQTPHMATYQK